MTKENKQEFFKYVSLNVLGMVALSLYFVVDTIFIGQALGNNGLAALNFAIPLFGVIHASGLMIGVGGAIKYNVFKSQGQQLKANRVFTSTLVFGVVLSLIFMILGLFFHDNMTRLLGARVGHVTFNMTADYVRVILLFSPLYILHNILVAFIRNDGMPAIAMGGLLTSSVANITFDYLFLFVLPLGMFGAAIASSIGALLGLIPLSMFFILKKNTVTLGPFKGAFKFWPLIITLGLSTFLINFSYSAVMSLFNRLLDGLQGTTAVAAYSIIANLSLLSISVFVGVSQGVQPLLTQAYSKNDSDKMRHILALASFLIIALSTVIYTMFWFFGDVIVSGFNRDHDLVLQALAVEGMNIYFIGLFFAGLNILYSVFFSAIERPRFGLFIVLLRGLVIIIPISIILSRLYGVRGVWFSFLLAEALTLLIAYIVYIFKVKASDIFNNRNYVAPEHPYHHSEL